MTELFKKIYGDMHIISEDLIDREETPLGVEVGMRLLLPDGVSIEDVQKAINERRVTITRDEAGHYSCLIRE